MISYHKVSIKKKIALCLFCSHIASQHALFSANPDPETKIEAPKAIKEEKVAKPKTSLFKRKKKKKASSKPRRRGLLSGPALKGIPIKRGRSSNP